MSLKLRPTESQLSDLRRIVDLGPEQLENIQQQLRGNPGPVLRPQELLDAVSNLVAPDDAEALVRQLLALQGFVRQSGQALSDVIAGIGNAIEERPEESGIVLESWNAVKDRLESLAGEQSVRLAATAIELAYDYANLLRRTKILTDIRPIYTLDAEHIEGAVVSYTLRISYDSANNEHELSIALDEADIKKLKEQCERAMRKAATATALMTSCKVPTSVQGSNDND